MSPLTVRVTGVERVQLRLEGNNAKVRANVWKAIANLGLRLEANVKAVWLSGRALHRRTGRLASSVNSKFTATERSATSRTGTNLPYGSFWELGFHGIEQVRGHTRRVKSRNVHAGVWGKSNIEGLSKVFHPNKGKVIARGFAIVRPFSRTVNQAARPFLKPALEGMRLQIREEIRLAVAKGLAGGA